MDENSSSFCDVVSENPLDDGHAKNNSHFYYVLPDIVNPDRLSAFFCIDVDRTAANHLLL
jgi:hypothetical protein